MDIVVWLRSLGLGKYEAVFRRMRSTNGSCRASRLGPERAPCASGRHER